MAFLDRNNCIVYDEALKSERKPRICMLTTRGFDFRAFMCGFYEGQDILMDIDDVDLIYLEPKNGYEYRKNLHEIILWHGLTQKMHAKNIAFKPIKLTKEYDLFIAYLPYFVDFIQIPAIQGLKDHCRTSICWINELWSKDVKNPKFKDGWLPAIAQFDHIALGLTMTAKLIGDVLKRPCDFVPVGVDTMRFNAYPEPVTRVIDIYSMGRALQGLHESFLGIAANNNLFYMYDTFNTGDARIRDYRQHRDMLANIAKRSQYFIVAPAKVDSTDEVAGQIEIGARYFEAAAAGAVLLGQAPKCESFYEMFNWPDSVIEILPDGSDVNEVLSSFVTQPERLMEISRRNTQEALLRHDWVYRWKQILNIAGLESTPQLSFRENKLKSMALEIQSGELNQPISSESSISRNKYVII